jgi:dephospho-CoA kinase
MLNRDKLLKAIVFNNPEKEVLNAIVHPAVKDIFDNWITQNQNVQLLLKKLPFYLMEIQRLDQIITVSAPLETRNCQSLKER